MINKVANGVISKECWNLWNGDVSKNLNENWKKLFNALMIIIFMFFISIVTNFCIRQWHLPNTTNKQTPQQTNKINKNMKNKMQKCPRPTSDVKKSSQNWYFWKINLPWNQLAPFCMLSSRGCLMGTLEKYTISSSNWWLVFLILKTVVFYLRFYFQIET